MCEFFCAMCCVSPACLRGVLFTLTCIFQWAITKSCSSWLDWGLMLSALKWSLPDSSGASLCPGYQPDCGWYEDRLCKTLSLCSFSYSDSHSPSEELLTFSYLPSLLGPSHCFAINAVNLTCGEYPSEVTGVRIKVELQTDKSKVFKYVNLTLLQVMCLGSKPLCGTKWYYDTSHPIIWTVIHYPFNGRWSMSRLKLEYSWIWWY